MTAKLPTQAASPSASTVWRWRCSAFTGSGPSTGRTRRGARSPSDGMSVDPSVRRFLDLLGAMNPPSALSLAVGQRRQALQQLLQFAGLSVPVGQVENRSLPGPAGELAVRLYTPV